MLTIETRTVKESAGMNPGQSLSENFTRNRLHYDRVYRYTRIDGIVGRIRDVAGFLGDATRTDTSWHAMYQFNLADRLRGKKVLELGSGDGMNALVMAALGADVTAVDIAERCKELLDQGGAALGLRVHALVGDFLRMDFPERSFDFVIGKSFLHHLTHEEEEAYLARVARLLKDEGEARFFEPAVNSTMLDLLRYAVPVPGRPSMLQRRAFAQWKASDPHPERDNSTGHYMDSGRKFFRESEYVLIGSIERLHRLLPGGRFNRRYRRWAHRVEPSLPRTFRYIAARSQTIIYRGPMR